MSATETIAALSPPSVDIIDVDALEDDQDDIQVTGFHRHRPYLPIASSSHGRESPEIAYMGFRESTRRSYQPRSARAGPSSRLPEARRSSADIIILDSDDEDAGASSSRPRRRSDVGRRFFSPPPPPPQGGPIPAVPALPRHLASQRSLPRRRQRAIGASQDPPPVIRPSAHPLPFERMASLPRLPPRNSSPALVAAAPRSHHQPAMGFGGALLALNRQNAIEEANRQRDREARNSFNMPTFSELFARWSGSARGSNPPSRTSGTGISRWQRFWPALFDNPAEDNRHLSPFGDDDAWFETQLDFAHRKQPEKEVHWKREYTHPNRLDPGFTSDFAPLDDSTSTSGSSSTVIDLDADDQAGPSHAASSSSSATAVETTLVCARCLDPLVLAAPEGVSEEEQKKYRVWALRCGHMLDGKCITELSTPPLPAPSAPCAEVDTGSKGKGKARADPDSSTGEHEQSPGAPSADASVPAPSSDRKGKRKAVEQLEPDEPAKQPALAEPSGGSIRSRLRSHTRVAVFPPDELAAHAEASSESLRSRRRRRRGALRMDEDEESLAGFAGLAALRELQNRGKGKGKARARVPPKPLVEAEHEWRCPIASCGRVHYSVRIEGEWRNDESRGGIALFL